MQLVPLVIPTSVGRLKSSRELQNLTLTSTRRPAPVLTQPAFSAGWPVSTCPDPAGFLPTLKDMAPEIQHPLTAVIWSLSHYIKHAILFPVLQNKKTSILPFPYHPISLLLFTAKFLEVVSLCFRSFPCQILLNPLKPSFLCHPHGHRS